MKQIIALGGGGFSMELNNPLLDQFIIQQSGKEKPAVCFLPTASGDDRLYEESFNKAFSALGCLPSSLLLSNPPSRDLRDYIMEKDILMSAEATLRK
ncbi:Type 1 glutamine amidotransferase-like domain-containing protein [Bacillus sp. 1P06AnD]